jgi:hypothetical protein
MYSPSGEVYQMGRGCSKPSCQVPTLQLKFAGLLSSRTDTVDNWVQRLAGIGVVVAPINAMDARM